LGFPIIWEGLGKEGKGFKRGGFLNLSEVWVFGATKGPPNCVGYSRGGKRTPFGARRFPNFQKPPWGVFPQTKILGAVFWGPLVKGTHLLFPNRGFWGNLLRALKVKRGGPVKGVFNQKKGPSEGVYFPGLDSEPV